MLCPSDHSHRGLKRRVRAFVCRAHLLYLEDLDPLTIACVGGRLSMRSASALLWFAWWSSVAPPSFLRVWLPMNIENRQINAGAT